MSSITSHNRKGEGLRLLLLSGCIILCQWGCTEPEPTADDIFRSACGYLWGQQAEDGGWHSETHGLLRGGQVWTAYILYQLLEAPESACPRPPGGVVKGLAFIRRHLTADGVLGLSDPDVLEYPNYATGYALRLLAKYGDPSDQVRIASIKAYLKAEQFDEARGISPDHPAYGSWGFGEPNLGTGQVGHVDLSHTRRSLQALRMAGVDDEEMYLKALAYLGLVQKHPKHLRIMLHEAGRAYDGGFFSSPVVLAVNKSKALPTKKIDLYESYATATCDGVLGLLAAGVDPEDERIESAKAWLQSNPDLREPAGMNRQDPNQWHEVLFFYHLAVRAEAYAALEMPGTWRDEMVQLLATRQQWEGRFFNPYGALNKEDDPLLATAMAVKVLTKVRACCQRGLKHKPDSTALVTVALSRVEERVYRLKVRRMG